MIQIVQTACFRFISYREANKVCLYLTTCFASGIKGEEMKNESQQKNKPNSHSQIWLYRKLTDACQTKANNKKKTGITGNTSTMGSNGAYASGNFASIRSISSNYPS